MQHHRHSGVNEVVRILPCTCGGATLDARRLLLLASGDVERNPGPQIRGAQWNSGWLSRAKRGALERSLHEDMVLFCLLQETHLASAECAALKIGGCHNVGQARTSHGDGVSILVREGVGVEVGVLEKKVPERATVTLRFSANVIPSPHPFPAHLDAVPRVFCPGYFLPPLLFSHCDTQLSYGRF
ncbi:hypothetical protein TRVL_06641 [Trypanosoma vivax]|nr:hypothetical protein TRVL_06641 [Trypanosoma vivax]